MRAAPGRTCYMRSVDVRRVCGRCLRPVVACWCAGLVPVASTTRVVILQHPRERRMPIGTGRMTRLALANSVLHRGVRFASDVVPSGGAALLWPGADARPPSDFAGAPPGTLVVLDGTWREARKLLHRNAFLQRLPRIGFTPAAPSDYRIRRAPAAHCWATVEAVAHGLGVLEDRPTAFAALLDPFRRLVDFQSAYGRGVRPTDAPATQPLAHAHWKL